MEQKAGRLSQVAPWLYPSPIMYIEEPHRKHGERQKRAATKSASRGEEGAAGNGLPWQAKRWWLKGNTS
eukprot:1546622-Pleurochrysis_carterae.AAC.1